MDIQEVKGDKPGRNNRKAYFSRTSNDVLSLIITLVVSPNTEARIQEKIMIHGHNAS
jgi:hypothetical protein